MCWFKSNGKSKISKLLQELLQTGNIYQGFDLDWIIMKHGFKLISAFIVLSILGIAVIPLLSVDLNPSPNDYSFTVSYELPQSSPELVEQQATSPLENIFSQLSDLKKIYSVSNYNSGSIELTFGKDTDLAFKKFEISALIRQVYSSLNPALSYPRIADGGRDTDRSPLLIYQVKGPFATSEIKKMVEDNLLASLSRIAGVEQLEVSGAEDLQISIRFDQKKLEGYGVSADDIIGQLDKQFEVTYPGLYRMPGGQSFALSAGNRLIRLDQLENVIVRQHTGQQVLLKHLATVNMEETEPRRYFRVNSQNAVILSVQAAEGVNRIKVADEVYSTMNKLSKSLSQGTEIIRDYDDTEFLRGELSKIYQRAGLSMFILTLFIFLINRNLRYLLVLFTGIIINLCLTSLCAWFLGINVHLYTIAGVTIAFGLIVDNSIVMIDHLFRKRNLKVFTALLGASLTTIASLMLIFFLPDEEKSDLLEFGQIIAVSLATSLVIALFYTPSAFYLLGVSQKEVRVKKRSAIRWKVRFFMAYSRVIAFFRTYRKSFVTVVILAFGLPVFMLPSTWEDYPLYNSSIGSDTYQEDIRPVVDRVFGGALRLFVRNVYEKSGYRTPEKTRLYVNASLPYGSTLDQMNAIIQKVEDYLATVKGINKFITRISGGRYGRITIEFDPSYENGVLPYQLKSRLIAQSLDWGGVKWNIYGVGRGFSNAGGDGLPSFRVLMKGYNYNELEGQAGALADKLIAHKRIQEVNVNERLSWSEQGTKEFVWTPNTFAIISAGLSPDKLTHQLDVLSKPTGPALYLNVNNRNMPVYLKEQNSESFSSYDLSHKVLTADSALIDIGRIGSLQVSKTVNAIHKEDRQYLRVVGFEYYGSHKFGNAYLDKILAIQKEELPLGYTAEKLTWQWNWNKAKRQYGLLLILILAIYFICSILFENLKQPLFIISCIPISFIGLFLTFAVFDFYFDQGGYAAFILLGGLVVNAAIFVVTDLNNLRTGNYNRNVIKALLGKAQPILLTILSTCFGLVPFLIEGQNEVFWFSLAIGTIGGMVFSVFAVFVCLPVFLIGKKVRGSL